MELNVYKKKHLNSDRKQRKLQIKDLLELSDVLKIPKLRFPKFLDIFIAKEFFWGSFDNSSFFACVQGISMFQTKNIREVFTVMYINLA